MSNDLLKCLECRLIGAPPVFNLAPPPKLPIDFLLVEMPINEDLFYLTNKRKAASMSKRQKCLNLKNYLDKYVIFLEKISPAIKICQKTFTKFNGNFVMKFARGSA